MKIEYLDVDGITEKLNTKAIIIYNERRGCWEVQSKDTFLKNIYEEMCVINDLIVNTREELRTFKKNVNQKLEEQHKVLQVLTKDKIGD